MMSCSQFAGLHFSSLCSKDTTFLLKISSTGSFFEHKYGIVMCNSLSARSDYIRRAVRRAERTLLSMTISSEVCT